MGCQLSSEEEDYLSQRRAKVAAQNKIAGKRTDDERENLGDEDDDGVDEILTGDDSVSDDSPYTSPRAQRQKYVKRNQERMIMDSPLQRASRSQQQLGLPVSNNNSSSISSPSSMGAEGVFAGTPVNANATILGAAIVGANNNSSNNFGLDGASSRSNTQQMVRTRDDDPRWSLISLENDPSTIAGSLSKTMSTHAGFVPPPPLLPVGGTVGGATGGEPLSPTSLQRHQSSSSILVKSPSKRGTESRKSPLLLSESGSNSFQPDGGDLPSPVSPPAALPPAAVHRTSTKPTLLKVSADGSKKEKDISSLLSSGNNSDRDDDEHDFKPYRPPSGLLAETGVAKSQTSSTPPSTDDLTDDSRPLPASHHHQIGECVASSFGGGSSCGNTLMSPADSLSGSLMEGQHSRRSPMALPTYAPPSAPPPPKSPGVFEELIGAVSIGDDEIVRSNSTISIVEAGIPSSSKATLPPPPSVTLLLMPDFNNTSCGNESITPLEDHERSNGPADTAGSDDPLLCLVSPKAPYTTPVQRSTPTSLGGGPGYNSAFDNSFVLSNSSMSSRPLIVGGATAVANSSLSQQDSFQQQQLLSNSLVMNSSLAGANFSFVASSSLIMASPKKAITFLVDSPQAATAMETPHGDALAVPVSVKEEERLRKKASSTPSSANTTSLVPPSPLNSLVEGAMIQRGGKTVFHHPQQQQYQLQSSPQKEREGSSGGSGASTPSLISPLGSPSKRSGSSRVLTPSERQQALFSAPISVRPGSSSSSIGGDRASTPLSRAQRSGSNSSTTTINNGSTSRGARKTAVASTRYKERWNGYQEMVFDAQDQEIIFGTNAPQYSNRQQTSSLSRNSSVCSSSTIGGDKRGSWRMNRLLQQE